MTSLRDNSKDDFKLIYNLTIDRGDAKKDEEILLIKWQEDIDFFLSKIRDNTLY